MLEKATSFSLLRYYLFLLVFGNCKTLQRKQISSKNRYPLRFSIYTPRLIQFRLNPPRSVSERKKGRRRRKKVKQYRVVAES